MATLQKDEVTEFLKRFQTQYEKSDLRFFENFHPEATFFTVSTPTRVDGLEEYRRIFEPQFTGAEKRRSQILSPHIHIGGESAVVTYHNRISIDGRTTNLCVSITVTKQPDGQMKILNFHSSYQTTPALTGFAKARNVDEINILEERVATAAAAVGTPK